MRFSKTTLFGGLLALAGIAALGWYIVGDFQEEPIGSAVTENNGGNSGTTTRTIGGITFEGEGDVVVEEVPIGEAGPAPALDRPVNPPATLSAEAAAGMRKEIAQLTTQIKTDPGNSELWLVLGLRRQEIADYEGAREIYDYVTRLLPSDSTAYINLGNLYHYYLKDFPKAEQYFLKALERDRKVALVYLNLHDLYRYSYKTNTAAAADILKQGIKENPEAVDLYVALGAYYKTQGKRADAKKYYEQAQNLAIASGNTALREAIGKELASL
jgi:Tfp pilus assembly protein PilF